MHCWIYRSSKKEEMYLYLREKDQFKDIPEALLKRIGKLEFVMQLQLHPKRKLAREDVNKVMENLRTQGFHLQMPPVLMPKLYRGE